MLALVLLACTPPAATDTSPAPADTAVDSGHDTGTLDTADTGAETGTDTADTGTPADTGETGDTASIAPTFRNDVVPVFQTTCADCHHDWGAEDPDTFYAFLTDVRLPLIVAGDRDGSELYDKIAHTAPADGRARMPPATPLLDSDTLSALAAWIDSGANDDSAWTGLFGMVWMDRHCHNCHEEWGKDPNSVRTTLLSTTEGSYPLIDAGSHSTSYVYLKAAWDPPPDYGDQMPKTFDYLDADVIERIGLWIDAGAPND